MSAAHTPGPWAAKRSEYLDETIIVQSAMPSNRVLAQFDGDGDGADETDEANALLIAASPDLLAALQSVMDEWRDGYGLKCAEQCRAAILKATP